MFVKTLYLSCKYCALVEEIDSYLIALPYVRIDKERFLCKDCLKIYLQSKAINKKMRK